MAAAAPPDDRGRSPDDDADVASPGRAAVPAAGRDALFDLAVARADAYLRRARRPATADAAGLRSALEPWALKTRFASRIDLDELVAALAARPSDAAAGDVGWRGGRGGGWVRR
jgi:hypothetical protein